MCYHTKFRRFGLVREYLTILDDAGVPVPWVPSLRDAGAADPSETSYCSYVLSHQISFLYVKPFGRNYGNPPEKFDPPPVSRQKVTHGHWNRN